MIPHILGTCQNAAQFHFYCKLSTVHVGKLHPGPSLCLQAGLITDEGCIYTPNDVSNSILKCSSRNHHLLHVVIITVPALVALVQLV